MAGVILGRHPGLADAAVLVACPCDVPRWRAMSNRRGGTPWVSESPHHYVDRIPIGSAVSVVIGDGDNVTAPVLSKSFAADLAARGIAAELIVVEGLGHADIIGSTAVVMAALRLAGGH